MHVPWSDNKIDHVQDDMFSPGQFRDDVGGAEYGPYQIANYAERVGRAQSDLFTMSTWNPYQAVLMTTIVTLQDIDRA